MRFGLCILVMLVALGISPARLAVAQEQTEDTYTVDEYVEHIRETVLDAQQRYVDGDTDTAIADLRAFNTEVDQYEGFMDGHQAFHWPDLVLSRILFEEGKDRDVVRLSSTILVALDTTDHRSSNTRLEAHYLMARALYRMRKFADAEPVLRNWYPAAQDADNPDPEWGTWIDYMLSRVTTWLATTDANDIRARALENFTEREGATNHMYQMLIHEELQAWREDDDQDPDEVLELAHNFESWLRDFDLTLNVSTSLRLVGLIYAENGDNERAHALFTAHRDTVRDTKGPSGDYYWAVQNVVHNLHDMGRFEEAITQSRAFFATQAPDTPQTPEEADALAQIRSAEHRALKAVARIYEANAAAIEAYRLIRTFRSANHTDALTLRRRVEPALVPATHTFAREFTTWDDSQTELAMTADGAAVINEFLDGNYLDLQDKVQKAIDDPDADQALMTLTTAYNYALLGQINVMMSAVEAGRAVVRSPGQHALPANTHLFDLAEVIGKIFARQSKPRTGVEALTRLEARKDLDAQTNAIVRALRILFESREGNPANARRAWTRDGTALIEQVDMTHMGVLLGLIVIDQGYVYGDTTLMDAFYDDFTTQLRDTGRYQLALVIADVFRVNSSPVENDDQGTFQRLGVRINALSRMLPDEHQWNVATRVNYAFSLQARRQYDEAAELFETTALSYRESPSHRDDVYGFFQVNRAWTLWFAGEAELAQSIIDQVHSRMDPDTWDPGYVYDVVFKQAVSLNVQDRTEQSLAAMNAIISQKPKVFARMQPADQSTLLGQRALVAARMGQTEQARDSYDQSVRVLPSEDYQQGWPMAQALYNRATWLAGQGDQSAAYTDVAKSNQLWFGYYDQGLGRADVRDANEDRKRVVEQALLGWQLAEQLAAGE